MQQRPNVLKATWQLAPAVSIIVAINIAVLILWHLADRGSGLEKFMAGNFLVSTLHLQEGRVWTLVTSAFSHFEVWHIGLNMFVLWSFGLVLEQFWQRRVFVGFYLIASVTGSACHCLASSYLLGDNALPALGASGAVSGLLMAYALHFPHKKILLFGLLPIPALVGVIGFVSIDVWGLIEQSRGGGVAIGHGAHLGGALAGGLMWLFYLRRRFSPREARLTADETAELNRIGTKLRELGPESLTREEYAFVEQVRGRAGRLTSQPSSSSPPP